MRRGKRGFVIPLLAAALCALLLCGCTQGDAGKEPTVETPEIDPIDMPGARREYTMDGYSEDIASEDVVLFAYDAPDFRVRCEKNADGSVSVQSSGGDVAARDGSGFRLDYTAADDGFLEKLQQLVAAHDLTADNGRVVNVGGLPEGYGDTLSVTYASGERIYKSSNESRTVSDEAAVAIYEAFRDMAVKNGFDFTTEGSNAPLYDDADEAFLQGTWKGTHFGSEYVAVFTGNRVQIYCDGELTDDTEYVVVRGSIRPNRLKEGVRAPEDEHDYEEFHDMSSMRKKNDIFLVGYFTKDAYSTVDLLRQN